jgi:hypothetical protein
MKRQVIIDKLVVAHSPEREAELQELCKQVLNANPERYYNPNGADETICPFCYAKDYSNDCSADIEDIKHEINCAYNIAKGLSEGCLEKKFAS